MDTRKLAALQAEAIDLDVAGHTDVGRERKRNEDQFLVATLQRSLMVKQTSLQSNAQQWLPSGSEGTILLVADGMGGGTKGDVASSVAVQAIANYLCSVIPWASRSRGPAPTTEQGDEDGELRAGRGDPSSTLTGVRTGLATALAKGDAEVRRVAQDSDAVNRMGTTVTMAYLLWPRLYVAHVGDSRCYLLRNGVLAQLTTDHTYAEKLRKVSNTPIDPSSPWHHVLWNVIGAEKSAFEPELHRITLQPGDCVLLCSDGLNKHVPDPQVIDVLQRPHSAEKACDILVTMANEAGGTDNITAVVAYCRPSAEDVSPTLPDPEPPMMTPTKPLAPAIVAAEPGPEPQAQPKSKPKPEPSEAPTQVFIPVTLDDGDDDDDTTS